MSTTELTLLVAGAVMVALTILLAVTIRRQARRGTAKQAVPDELRSSEAAIEVEAAPGDTPATPVTHTSRPRESERTTRKPLGWWDRSKILFLLLGSFLALVWSTMAEFAGLISFQDALAQTV